MNGRRLLFVSSSTRAWAESQDSSEQFRAAPYSIDAIGYNLEKRGWTVGWVGRKNGHNPMRLARRIDSFKPDVTYTNGATLSLHPFFCRKFLCKWKDFKVVHGWDDHYGCIWGDLAGYSGAVREIFSATLGWQNPVRQFLNSRNASGCKMGVIQQMSKDSGSASDEYLLFHEGKKRMKELGQVNFPQSAFTVVLKRGGEE